MTATGAAARHFDAHAARFEAIYAGGKGPVGSAIDRVFRENVRWRLWYTLEVAGAVDGKRVLDVGCGPGRYCAEFAARGAEVVGVDGAPTMLDLARRLAAAGGVSDRCRFVCADALDFHSKESFDL